MKSPETHRQAAVRPDVPATKAVLFVDNETAVLDGIRRSLFRMRDIWDMHFTNDYAQAMACLEARKFDVVVSDIGAARGSGLNFIREVSRRWPQVIRIALTGDIEDETAMEALAHTHQFLTKPAEVETISTAVRRATRMQAILGGQRVDAVIGNLQRIPSLPTSYRRLAQVIDDPDADLGDAAIVIELDSGLASGILRIVNSAYFGLSREINTIVEALTFIGVDTLKGIVLQNRLFKSIEIEPASERVASDLIGHGLDCGTYARRLAAGLGLSSATQGLLYMTGLTHEFGKLVMLSAYGGDYLEFLRATDGDANQCDLECARFGADHVAMGAYLFGIWGFPDKMVDLIAMQHSIRAWREVEDIETAVMLATYARFHGEGTINYSRGISLYSHDNPLIQRVAQAQAELA